MLNRILLENSTALLDPEINVNVITISQHTLGAYLKGTS